MAAEGRQTRREIIALVAERHGLTVDEMISPARERRIAWPRQEAMTLMSETGRWSEGQIGLSLARTSWTVRHGISEYRRRLAKARP